MQTSSFVCCWLCCLAVRARSHPAFRNVQSSSSLLRCDRHVPHVQRGTPGMDKAVSHALEQIVAGKACQPGAPRPSRKSLEHCTHNAHKVRPTQDSKHSVTASLAIAGAGPARLARLRRAAFVEACQHTSLPCFRPALPRARRSRHVLSLPEATKGPSSRVVWCLRLWEAADWARSAAWHARLCAGPALQAARALCRSARSPLRGVVTYHRNGPPRPLRAPDVRNLPPLMSSTSAGAQSIARLLRTDAHCTQVLLLHVGPPVSPRDPCDQAT